MKRWGEEDLCGASVEDSMLTSNDADLYRSSGLLLLAVAATAGCALGEEPASVDEASQDGEHDSFLAGGKADTGPVEPGSVEALGVLKVARETSLEDLDASVSAGGVGLWRLSAVRIVDFRLGEDGLAGTAADGVIVDLPTLDAIPYVGPAAFSRLLAFAQANGYVKEPDSGDAAGAADEGALGLGTRWRFSPILDSGYGPLASTPDAAQLAVLVRRAGSHPCIFALEDGAGNTSRGKCTVTDRHPNSWPYHWAFKDSTTDQVREFEMRWAGAELELKIPGSSQSFRMKEDPSVPIPAGLQPNEPRPRIGHIAGDEFSSCRIGPFGGAQCWGDGSPGGSRQPAAGIGAPASQRFEQVVAGNSTAYARTDPSGAVYDVYTGRPQTYGHDNAAAGVRRWTRLSDVAFLSADAKCRTHKAEYQPYGSGRTTRPGSLWCLDGRHAHPRRVEVGHQLLDVATAAWTGFRCGRVAMSGGDLWCSKGGIAVSSVRAPGPSRHGICAIKEGPGAGLYCGDEDAPFRKIAGLPAELLVHRSSGSTDCVVSASHQLYCWGNNFGRIFSPAGIAPDQYSVATPTLMPGLANVLDVAVGAAHLCALRIDGSVACWGRNTSQQVAFDCQPGFHKPTGVCREYYEDYHELFSRWP